MRTGQSSQAPEFLVVWISLKVQRQPGVSTDPLRKWVHKADVDTKKHSQAGWSDEDEAGPKDLNIAQHNMAWGDWSAPWFRGFFVGDFRQISKDFHDLEDGADG